MKYMQQNREKLCLEETVNRYILRDWIEKSNLGNIAKIGNIHLVHTAKGHNLPRSNSDNLLNYRPLQPGLQAKSFASTYKEHTLNEQLLKIENILLESPQSYVFMTAIGVFVGGLVLWAGGLRYLKLVCGMLGGAVGAGIGSLLANYLNLPVPATVGIAAAVCALAAVLLQQVLILVVATVIFGLIFGGSFMEYTLGKQQTTDGEYNNMQSQLDGSSSSGDENWYAAQVPARPQEESVAPGAFQADNPFGDSAGFGENLQKLAKAEEYAGSVFERIKAVLSELTPTISNNAGMLTMWCVLGAIIGLVLAQMLKTIVMALCCSIVGSTALIAGTIMAIIAKQTAAWTMLQGHGRVMSMVFGGMVLFGWLFQIITGGGKHSHHHHEDEESSKE